MTDAPALAARGLSHRLADRVLYDGLDLDLRRGRICVVAGPNGAGKSTLLRTLAGLDRPQAGRIELLGDSLAALSPAARARRLAYLPQHCPAEPDLLVREVVLLGRLPNLPRFGPPRDVDAAAAAAALERLGLGAFADRPVGQLSGGERQRVMLARMLAADAAVVILDEPAAGLDIGHALGLYRHLRALAGEGVAVLVAEHDLDLARRHADDAVLLAAGRARVGPCSAVFSPEHLGAAFGVVARERDGRLWFEAST
ncbi:ABC transporter ATP-binding protein [Nannocystis radixulma]|uniref:ABC transporter ATP-binding protein n=1 Tax=Nannocystis radixulma TaxID=2995305 RepID=A0ABT5BJD0_9BACT|nr:ABC transporter ATP-binding protein [Nannocystis radixulma]MDC0674261.1 ABC transporter ATP-binding protein [Nannocystis radixulma]